MSYFSAGGPLMWFLLTCSIVSLTVIIERFYFWARLGAGPDRERAERILASAMAGTDAAARHASQNQGPISRMLEAGRNSQAETCALAMEISAACDIEKMRKGMKLLDTIITASPMIGILGTVTGIMSSFDALGASAGSNHQAVISGLAQALITTAYGLGISIAIIFPYNYFNSRIEEMAFLFEFYGDRLEKILSVDRTEGANEN